MKRLFAALVATLIAAPALLPNPSRSSFPLRLAVLSMRSRAFLGKRS
jgi:hypothetical protein